MTVCRQGHISDGEWRYPQQSVEAHKSKKISSMIQRKLLNKTKGKYFRWSTSADIAQMLIFNQRPTKNTSSPGSLSKSSYLENHNQYDRDHQKGERKELAFCFIILSLLLGYLGAKTQMTEECLKNFLVSSSCVAITPSCNQIQIPHPNP